MGSSDPDGSPSSVRASFPSTHWSLVLAAGLAPSPASQEALAHLCRAYWYPLYAYVRRRGYSPEDAQDLTQEFFARFLERKYPALADATRGRFRTFLLTSLQNFLNDDWDRARAAKRGGGRAQFHLDMEEAEQRYGREPAGNLPPDKLYERRWATALMAEALARLREECVAAGRGDQFAALRSVLSDPEASLPHARLAAELDMTESSVRGAASRLRARYRRLLLNEIAQTVAGPGELQDEIRHLFAAFA